VNTTKAEPAPLDIYIMLDISRSMLDPTSGGEQKWTAVKNAINAFLRDPGSSGLGVGIQYFPLRKPGVPAECTSNEQCGSGGPCFLKMCSAYPASVPSGLASCVTDADCKAIPAALDYGPCVTNACSAGSSMSCAKDADCIVKVMHDFGPCVSFGQCENDRSLICQAIGKACGLGPAGNDLGNCVDATASVCFHGTQCDADAYATPAVEIVPLGTSSATLIASVEAQLPDGDTPTPPALSGAIRHAQQWATAHPGHTVVAVLATDGLPTECLSNDASFLGTVPTEALVDDVAAIANEGLRGSPSIATFVIGVFSGADAGAPANLARIADAGGTGTAQIIDTGGDVTQQFLRALNAIRKSRLACEFQLPAPMAGDKLDYFAVNVEFADGATTTPLYYIGAPERCDAEGGWYYDDRAGVNPTKILVCPSNCERFQQATSGAVQIKLGCKTIPR
jgi:hypothetical protein